MKKKFIVLCVAAAFMFMASVTGCEKKGPAEKAGEKIDKSVESMKEAAKEVGDDINDAVDKAKD